MPDSFFSRFCRKRLKGPDPAPVANGMQLSCITLLFRYQILNALVFDLEEAAGSILEARRLEGWPPPHPRARFFLDTQVPTMASFRILHDNTGCRIRPMAPHGFQVRVRMRFGSLNVFAGQDEFKEWQEFGGPVNNIEVRAPRRRAGRARKRARGTRVRSAARGCARWRATSDTTMGSVKVDFTRTRSRARCEG